MKKVNIEEKSLPLQNIILATTSEPDYESYRKIFCTLKDTPCDCYVIIEGGHCSCYGYDETEWEAIEYTAEELLKLADAPYNAKDDFWKQIKIQLGGYVY